MDVINRQRWSHLPVKCFFKIKNQCSYNRVNSQQSISLGEKLLLQRDHDDLHVAAGLLSKETGHLDSKNTFFSRPRGQQTQANKI